MIYYFFLVSENNLQWSHLPPLFQSLTLTIKGEKIIDGKVTGVYKFKHLD